MHSKSGIGANKASACGLFNRKSAKHSFMALAMLTPLMVPIATLANRSQTANTTPGVDVSSIAAVAAAEAPRPASAAGKSPRAGTSTGNVTGDNNPDPSSPVALPPEKTTDTSTDHGFSSEDFLHPDDGTRKPKKAEVSFTPAKPYQRNQDINLIVRINVPHNTDPVDRFVAYPYPMPVPIPRRPPGTKSPAASASSGSDPEVKPAVAPQAYDKMPSTRKGIRDLIMQTGYTTRAKRSVAYPLGGWRWQMAYRNALKRCPKSQPNIISELYPFIDAMEPLCREECEKFDELEEDRQRRYQTAFEEFQLNRNECEYEAVKKGYFPIEFNMSRAYRGKLAAAELKLGPGTWWLTGTHKVTGLTYYWQMPVQIVNGQVEDVELNWKNALVIQGGW